MTNDDSQFTEMFERIILNTKEIYNEFLELATESNDEWELGDQMHDYFQNDLDNQAESIDFTIYYSMICRVLESVNWTYLAYKIYKGVLSNE